MRRRRRRRALTRKLQEGRPYRLTARTAIAHTISRSAGKTNPCQNHLRSTNTLQYNIIYQVLLCDITHRTHLLARFSKLDICPAGGLTVPNRAALKPSRRDLCCYKSHRLVSATLFVVGYGVNELRKSVQRECGKHRRCTPILLSAVYCFVVVVHTAVQVLPLYTDDEHLHFTNAPLPWQRYRRGGFGIWW